MRLSTVPIKTGQLLPRQRHRFPAGTRKRHLNGIRVQPNSLGVVGLAVGGVAGVAELGDLGAALGVHGERGWWCVGWVEAEEGAVQGIEFLEFGGDGGFLGG